MKLPFTNRVSGAEKAFFVRQVATMIQAGLPLLRALSIVTEQTKNAYFRKILTSISQRVREGYQLSQAMGEYSDVFPMIFVAVIRSGETTGRLDKVMLELAKQQEEDNKLRGNILNAMLYPAFVVVAMMSIGIYLVFNVIPQIASLFAEESAQLPWVTKTLIVIVNGLTSYWYLAVMVIVVVILILRAFLRTTEGRLLWGKISLKIPVLKDINTGLAVTRFSRTMAMLTRAGVPVLEAVEIVRDTMNNLLFWNSLQQVRASLERGLPMSKPIMENPIYPPLVGQMIMVGEQSGKVDEVLDSVADYFQDRVNVLVKDLASLIEPVLVVLLGLGVAFIVFAVFIPVYELVNVI